MATLSCTVITIETTPATLRRRTAFVHDSLLDGDENLAIGQEVPLHNGAGTVHAARVDGRGGDTWVLPLTR